MAVHHSGIACAGATRIWHLVVGPREPLDSWVLRRLTQAGASKGRGVAYPTAAHSSHTQDVLVATSAASAAMQGSTADDVMMNILP